MVDDVTRECLAAIPDTSISGRRVARELTALIGRRGKPGMIVSDHGTEFTSNAMLSWHHLTVQDGPGTTEKPLKPFGFGGFFVCDRPMRSVGIQRFCWH
jgi:hypothetical protein